MSVGDLVKLASYCRGGGRLALVVAGSRSADHRDHASLAGCTFVKIMYCDDGSIVEALINNLEKV